MNAHVGDFAIPNTPPNAAMAATVQRRILADAGYQRAKNAFWRMSGLGVFAVLAGVGIAIAAYGYSFVTDQRAAGDHIGQAIADALRSVKLDGTVKVADGGIVKIEPGGTVRLEPGGIVRLEGGVTNTNGPRPTEQQIQPNALPSSAVKPVTNFTIFKFIKWEKGDVVTGWSYASSTDTKPNHQYCYYSYSTGEYVSARFTLASDGVPVARGTDWDFDNVAALSNCTWFNPVVEGRKT